MAQFKNLHYLPESFPQSDIDKIEHAATEHKRFNNISFKLMEYSPKKVIIQVSQERNAAKAYHTKNRLIEIGHESFDRFFPGSKIVLQPIPFVPSPVDDVTADWINKQMLKKGIRLKAIAIDTGIDYTRLSALVTGQRPLSQVTKAFFWYYFASK